MMNGIAAASMGISQAKMAMGVSTAVTKKAMDAQETQLQAMLEMLPPPQYNLDMRV